MDCDGKRVQATENGTLTKFIGGHYEVTGGQVTKYYMAGTSRIAMRKYTVPSSMSVEYLLGDHLGSTSITTDNTGAKVSEMRYKPWGEVRYSWTSAASTTPSYSLADYTFTGQYSYMDDPSTSGVTEGFGLMFYNARWYDPSLGRFSQPDTMIPQGQGVQGFDRYAYTNNNPLRYTDSTGHWIDIVVDGAFIGYDIYDISQNGLNWENGLALTADVVCAVLPIATGGGLAIRALMHTDDAVDAIKITDDIVDVAPNLDEIGEFIYKKGTQTYDSVTPRPGIDDLSIEDGGLSFWDSIDNLLKNNTVGPNDKIITVDPRKIDGLNINLDNIPPGHVSIKPSTLAELQEWSSTRGSDIIHKFTQTIFDSIVDVKKWKDWK